MDGTGNNYSNTDFMDEDIPTKGSEDKKENSNNKKSFIESKIEDPDSSESPEKYCLPKEKLWRRVSKIIRNASKAAVDLSTNIEFLCWFGCGISSLYIGRKIGQSISDLLFAVVIFVLFSLIGFRTPGSKMNKVAARTVNSLLGRE